MSFGELRIVQPRWTLPSWTVPGTPFELVVANMGGESVEAGLVYSGRYLPIDIDSVEDVDRGGLRRVTCVLSSDPAHVGDRALCGLRGTTQSGATTAPSSACVLRDVPEAFTFVHTSDLHLIAPLNGRLTDRRPLAEALVALVNALSPAFVLNTGDIISRYGVDTVRLSDAQIWWQTREVRSILLGLRVPMFTIPGNHDRAFEASRAAWRLYMGEPWGRATDDTVFEYGGARFVGIDGSHYCDEVTHDKLDSQRTPEQLAYLRRELGRASQARPRVVYSHWDYAGDIAEVLWQEGCDLFLIGHTSAPPAGDFPWTVGHLSGMEALRVWHVREGDVCAGQVVTYDELGSAPLLHIGLTLGQVLSRAIVC